MKSCQGVAAYATYQYAQLLLQTRSFKLPSGPVLCPLIDLTNHLSAGCNAKTKLEGGSGEGGEPCLVLRATRRLYAGEEVFQNYDGDADYSDIFERYGFLDKTANIHTAEVIIIELLLISLLKFIIALMLECFDFAGVCAKWVVCSTR